MSQDDRKFTMSFAHPLGYALTTEVTEAEILDTARHFGRKGWSPIPMYPGGIIQPGGARYPLDNEPDFDWALIGGYQFRTDDGEVAVWCRGYVWKRRELAPNPKQNLPAAVKYSRGALPTDPPDIVEDDGSGFKYVTLCMFRGGKRKEFYAKQGGQR